MHLHEDIALAPDETVAELIEKLTQALTTSFDFGEEAWTLATLASDWLILAVFHEGAPEYFKLSWTRGASGFEFGAPAAVEPKTVFVPSEPLPAAPEIPPEATTAGDVPVIPDAKKKKPKRKMGRTGPIGWPHKEENLVQLELLPIEDAIENPTTAQRNNLPDEAYASVFEVDGRSRRILPHHINSVRDPNSDDSVDLPRLRNALARFSQLRGVPDDVKRRALAHLEAHAERLKVGARGEDRQLAGDILAEIQRLLAGLAPLPAATTEERHVERTEAPAQFVELTMLGDISVKAEAQAAPNGKPFLAVLEGRIGRVDRVNENGRLYPRAGMRENAKRIGKRIERAYAAGASENNHEIIVGEADHPPEGPRLLASCTQLLEFKIEGDDVRGSFGIMDTTSGRDVLALREYGVPIGVSTRSRGRSERRMMDETNPLAKKNREYLGREYDEIVDFTLDAADLVVDPSAGTFIGESAPAEKQAELREALDRLCNPDDPECACALGITENDSEGDEDMDEKINEALGQWTVEQLKEAAPALYEAVVASVKPAPAPEPPKDDGKVGKLEEQVREQGAKLEAALAAIDELKGAKERAEFAAALETAIAEACRGKALPLRRGEHLRKSIGETRPEDLAGALKAASEAFDAEVAALTGELAEGVNAREVVETKKATTVEAIRVDALVPFPLTEARS